MNNIASRCIWSFLVTLAAFSTWTLCAAALNKQDIDQSVIAIAATSAAALVQLACWMLIWRKHIAFSAGQTMKISIGFTIMLSLAAYVSSTLSLQYTLAMPPLLPIWMAWAFAPSHKLQKSYALEKFHPDTRLLFTRNTAKIIATMCCLNIYAITAWMINEMHDMREVAMLQMAFICAAMGNALYIITIWHNIRWTAMRTVAITLSFTALLPLWLFSSEWAIKILDNNMLVLLPYILLFNKTLILILKRTASEARELYYDREMLQSFNSTIYCPYCNFNMTGLTKLRCPECGTFYRLDRLIYENTHSRIF